MRGSGNELNGFIQDTEAEAQHTREALTEEFFSWLKLVGTHSSTRLQLYIKVSVMGNLSFVFHGEFHLQGLLKGCWKENIPLLVLTEL